MYFNPKTLKRKRMHKEEELNCKKKLKIASMNEIESKSIVEEKAPNMMLELELTNELLSWSLSDVLNDEHYANTLMDQPIPRAFENLKQYYQIFPQVLVLL